MGDEMRDPRRDPRKGDVLRKGSSTRSITLRVANTVEINGGRWHWLSRWKRWAETAEVVERGEAFERGALGDGTHRMSDSGLRVLGTQDACKEAALESRGYGIPEA